MAAFPTQFAGETATWLLCILVFLLILWRPWRIPEYVWAGLGAVLLLAFGLLSPSRAWRAVKIGTNVYLFLVGMMLLAELARQHRVFDWLAALAMKYARGSQFRLFALVYSIGILVTALLSNDATAVLLTPAVLAGVRRTKTSPLPYLFACAFVANAAGFLLPISNPANLVVFDSHLPRLGQWLKMFLLPAIGALLVTFALLWWRSRRDLCEPLVDGMEPVALDGMGKRAGIGVLLAAGALLTTSALGGNVGLATFIAGFAAMVFVAGTRWRVMARCLRRISWGVLPLVAGLFVMVEALNGVGALSLCTHALQIAGSWHPVAGLTATAFGFGIAANAINNLPAGLIGAAAVQAAHGTLYMHAAILLGIDLGPNLSATGSLATILWLSALRRENVEISAKQFLRAGFLLMPASLLLAVIILATTLK